MKLTKKFKKKLLLSLLVGTICFGSLSIVGIKYLYDFAIARNEKDFMSSSAASGSSEPEQPIEQWTFIHDKPKVWSIKTKENLKLYGTYINNPMQKVNEKQKKIMVLVHGYTSNSRLLKQYAKMFYQLGYSLFLPDARGHGKSEGDYIGFGWPDRIDLIQWINKISDQFPNSEIGLWGISMGGAEVMMASGEKLPDQVKVIIEDCGYDSTLHQLEYQLKEMFNLPSFPIIPLASLYTRYKAGYDFYESDAVKQLKKNHLPTLFIHGDSDNFVPITMLDKVYQASSGPKEKVIFQGAGHAKSYSSNPEKYMKVCKAFLEKYMPPC